MPGLNWEKKPTVTKNEAFPEEFEKLAKKLKKKDPVTYNISGSFKPDEVIENKTFGMGTVTGVSYQKMEVVFSEGRRLLACNR